MRHDPMVGGGRPRPRTLARVLALVAVVLAAVAIPAVPSGAAEPSTPQAPAITATPATGLVQGDTITIAGTGFPASTMVAAIQCIPGDGVEFCSMGTLTYATTDASGSYSLTMTPRRILRIAGVDHDCSVAGACRIGSGTVPDGSGGTATVDIQFDPTVPPPPPPTITATPDTGLLDDQSIVVTGEGFGADEYVSIVQCVAPADPSTGTCRFTGTGVQASPTGTFTISVTVRRVLYSTAGGVGGTVTDCADAGACEILAASGYPYDGATTPIQFDGSVPLPPPPTVTATPDTDLLDGDTVSVSASGFDPGTQVVVLQCQQEEPTSGIGCKTSPLQTVQADSSGAIATDLVVDRLLYLTSGTVDCVVVGCRIVAADLGNAGYPNASATITFDSSVPPPPPPTLVADPSTGLVDGQTVTVHGSGYPRNRQLGMAQCLTGDQTSAGCDLTAYKFVTTDDTGSFTTTFQVKSSYESSGRGFVDCVQPQRCRLGAGTGEGQNGADAILTFSTAGPTTTTTTAGAQVEGADADAASPVAVAPTFTG
jgi:hypothetical protein